MRGRVRDVAERDRALSAPVGGTGKPPLPPRRGASAPGGYGALRAKGRGPAAPYATMPQDVTPGAAKPKSSRRAAGEAQAALVQQMRAQHQQNVGQLLGAQRQQIVQQGNVALQAQEQQHLGQARAAIAAQQQAGGAALQAQEQRHLTQARAAIEHERQGGVAAVGKLQREALQESKAWGEAVSREKVGAQRAREAGAAAAAGAVQTIAGLKQSAASAKAQYKQTVAGLQQQISAIRAQPAPAAAKDAQIKQLKAEAQATKTEALRRIRIQAEQIRQLRQGAKARMRGPQLATAAPAAAIIITRCVCVAFPDSRIQCHAHTHTHTHTPAHPSDSSLLMMGSADKSNKPGQVTFVPFTDP